MKKTEETANLDNEIQLSSGVVLSAKRVSPFVLLAVIVNHARPKPPTTFIETIGKEIENTDDPDYIERVKSWEREQSSVMLDALILYGTEVKRTPKGVSGHADNDWLRKISVLKLEVFPDNTDWRYLTWIKFVAVNDQNDLVLIRDKVGSLSGVKEADVKIAESFPGSD